MTEARPALTCPDCDEVLAFAFESTSGVGAHKRGDNFNTTPDTAHYVCFPCARAWKQRLSGPLTPDVVGDLAFFTCGDHSCGTAMMVTGAPASGAASGTELTCGHGHRWIVTAQGEGLVVAKEGR
jgi:hypothetical protein